MVYFSYYKVIRGGVSFKYWYLFGDYTNRVGGFDFSVLAIEGGDTVVTFDFIVRKMSIANFLVKLEGGSIIKL